MIGAHIGHRFATFLQVSHSDLWNKIFYFKYCFHTAPASAMSYNHQTKRLFVGMNNGYISEFTVADDYNRIKLVKNFTAHQGRVKEVLFSLEAEMVLSIGSDKYFIWYCSERGNRIGSYMCKFVCSALQ